MVSSAGTSSLPAVAVIIVRKTDALRREQRMVAGRRGSLGREYGEVDRQRDLTLVQHSGTRQSSVTRHQNDRVCNTRATLRLFRLAGALCEVAAKEADRERAPPIFFAERDGPGCLVRINRQSA